MDAGRSRTIRHQSLDYSIRFRRNFQSLIKSTRATNRLAPAAIAKPVNPFAGTGQGPAPNMSGSASVGYCKCITNSTAREAIHASNSRSNAGICRNGAAIDSTSAGPFISRMIGRAKITATVKLNRCRIASIASKFCRTTIVTLAPATRDKISSIDATWSTKARAAVAVSETRAASTVVTPTPIANASSECERDPPKPAQMSKQRPVIKRQIIWWLRMEQPNSGTAGWQNTQLGR